MEIESDELTNLKEKQIKINMMESSLKDLQYRYGFLMDFLVLQIVCFGGAFFMLGIRDFFEEGQLDLIFHRYWYFIIIMIALLLIESILVYLFFKKIIMFGNKIFIISLYVFFVLIAFLITCFVGMSLVMTCICYHAIILINLIFLIVMNFIKQLEDKNIIKLFVIYLTTLLANVLYISLINTKYIIFFMLSTSSLLYFTFMVYNYKRLLIINFFFLTKMNTKNDKIISISQQYLSISDEENYEYKERIALDKLSNTFLTKLSYITSLLDTFVYNFSS